MAVCRLGLGKVKLAVVMELVCRPFFSLRNVKNQHILVHIYLQVLIRCPKQKYVFFQNTEINPNQFLKNVMILLQSLQ